MKTRTEMRKYLLSMGIRLIRYSYYEDKYFYDSLTGRIWSPYEMEDLYKIVSKRRVKAPAIREMTRLLRSEGWILSNWDGDLGKCWIDPKGRNQFGNGIYALSDAYRIVLKRIRKREYKSLNDYGAVFNWVTQCYEYGNVPIGKTRKQALNWISNIRVKVP